MRWGEAVSPIGQTGQSDDTHSPDAWARMVVRRISPASVSIAVVCTVAISWRPRVLRTMSSPLESGAYRKVRSCSRGNGERMVAHSDFSGLTSSAWAFASAAAIAPIVSLDRCTGPLPVGEKIKADRARLRSLGADAVAGRFLCVLRHQGFELGFRPLVIEKGGARGAEETGEFRP